MQGRGSSATAERVSSCAPCPDRRVARSWRGRSTTSPTPRSPPPCWPRSSPSTTPRRSSATPMAAAISGGAWSARCPWSSSRSPPRCSAASPTTPASASRSSSASRWCRSPPPRCWPPCSRGWSCRGFLLAVVGARHLRGRLRLLQLLSAPDRRPPQRSAGCRRPASPSATWAPSSPSASPIPSSPPRRYWACFLAAAAQFALFALPAFVALPARPRSGGAARAARRPGRGRHAGDAARDPSPSRAAADARASSSPTSSTRTA